MQVKNIIKLVAKILLRDDLVSVLNSEATATSEQTADIDFLLSCFNLVNNTIAVDYVHLTEIVEKDNSSGKILFSDITSKNILDIISVKDNFNQNLKFKIEYDGLIAPKETIKIKFAYIPEEVALTDNITYYKTHIDEKIFAFGVLSEYYYINGNFDFASMWDSRFKQALLNSTRVLHNISIPKRQWI